MYATKKNILNLYLILISQNLLFSYIEMLHQNYLINSNSSILKEIKFGCYRLQHEGSKEKETKI